MSETNKRRESLARFCVGNGIDIGYGGDAIVPYAITIDLPTPYTCVGKDIQNLAGDGSNLYWFADGVLDFVYSSHLLEDFIDTISVIIEWFRVLRIGGKLVLLLPDEKKYREYSAIHGAGVNHTHKYDDFSLAWLLSKMNSDIKDGYKIVYSESLVAHYSFEIVFEKTGIVGEK